MGSSYASIAVGVDVFYVLLLGFSIKFICFSALKHLVKLEQSNECLMSLLDLFISKDCKNQSDYQCE